LHLEWALKTIAPPQVPLIDRRVPSGAPFYDGPPFPGPAFRIHIYMKRMYPFFALLFLLPVSARAQCKDQLCYNIQNILDAALVDFRGYIAHTVPLSDASTQSTKVPCSMNTWANNVPMLICYAQVPLSNATNWYADAMDGFKSLNPSWHFNIKTPGDNRYVDGGPPDCEPTSTEGPYIGQCPVHLEISKQPDGSAKIYLIVNSLTSPYLHHHSLLSPTPATPAQSAPTGVNVGASSGCDEFCQALKKAFEARATNFSGVPPDKLPGAKDCLVKNASADGATFICYWQEASASAAESRFHDLVARLQILVPSDWSSHQGNELDEQTGASVTAWHADEPGGKHAVRVYLSADAVALHITARK
jgi:hypothetical protein